MSIRLLFLSVTEIMSAIGLPSIRSDHWFLTTLGSNGLSHSTVHKILLNTLSTVTMHPNLIQSYMQYHISRRQQKFNEVDLKKWGYLPGLRYTSCPKVATSKFTISVICQMFQHYFKQNFFWLSRQEQILISIVETRTGWALVAHAFNPNIWKAETGGSL